MDIGNMAFQSPKKKRKLLKNPMPHQDYSQAPGILSPHLQKDEVPGIWMAKMSYGAWPGRGVLGSVAARGTRSRFTFEVGTAMERRRRRGCGQRRRGASARPRLLQPSRGVTPSMERRPLLRRRATALEGMRRRLRRGSDREGMRRREADRGIGGTHYEIFSVSYLANTAKEVNHARFEFHIQGKAIIWYRVLVTCQKRICCIGAAVGMPSGHIGRTMYTANCSFALILLAIFKASSTALYQTKISDLLLENAKLSAGIARNQHTVNT
uniref:Uncharacterized protein n=1 Tax=Oryza rufipogon TaxID=4529 RepID=A0A0E0P3P4_ORYRU